MAAADTRERWLFLAYCFSMAFALGGQGQLSQGNTVFAGATEKQDSCHSGTTQGMDG